jgi:hypothetical protein
MKNNKRQISIVLVLLLVFPMVYQTLHLFHGHGFQITSDKSHKSENKIIELHNEFDDCLICDFNYVVFLAGDQIKASSELVYCVLDFPLINKNFSFLFQGFNNLLRAPPAGI